MINIRIGKPLPVEHQLTQLVVELKTQPEVPTEQRLSVQFLCKFADGANVDYAAEAKLIQTSIQTLLKLSKSLNYIAKHVIEEFDITAGVKQVGNDHFLTLDLVVIDPIHIERLNNIVEKLKHKEATEVIRVELQSNTVGVPKEQKIESAGEFIHIKTQLYQGTKEDLKEALESTQDLEMIKPIIKFLLQFLSFKKLDLELDLATELWEMLPGGCPGILRKGLPKLEGNTKFPLTTSMKKIAGIFREKLVADWALTAQVGSLSFTASLRYADLFDNFLVSFIQL